MTISKAGAIKMDLLIAEWPEEGRRLGLTDPWAQKKFNAVDDEIMLQGKSVKCKKLVKNPGYIEYSEQEKADYRFEQDKFICRRLVEEGCWDKIYEELKYCYPSNKDRLAEYVATLKPCLGAGQCNFECGYYNKGCRAEN